MGPVEILGAGCALLASVVAGIVAHELSHAVVLRALGVSCDVEFVGRDTASLNAGFRGSLASVTPSGHATELPRSGLRIAALAPLGLATPLVLVAFGVVPNPFQSGTVLTQAAFIGWLGCALPSPQDFSVAWHAERVLAQARKDHEDS